MHNTLTQDVEVISPRSESTGVLPVRGGAHGQERAVGVRLRAVDEVQFVDTDAHKRLPCTVPLHSNLVPVLHVLAASSCRPGPCMHPPWGLLAPHRCNSTFFIFCISCPFQLQRKIQWFVYIASLAFRLEDGRNWSTVGSQVDAPAG
jgi:hypothetical protein